MRSAPPLLLALACNPAAAPVAADADAWRDIAELGECRHQIARDPAASAPKLSWETCPDDPEPGCERLVVGPGALRGPPHVHATSHFFGARVEIAGSSAGGDDRYLYAQDGRPYLGLRTTPRPGCEVFSIAAGGAGEPLFIDGEDIEPAVWSPVFDPAAPATSARSCT